LAYSGFRLSGFVVRISYTGRMSMDATRRVFRGLVIVIAAGLGAVLAVPLAVVLAAALYLRLLGMGLIACAQLLGLPPTPDSVAEVTSESAVNRLAS
jgi:hypothetical protein